MAADTIPDALPPYQILRSTTSSTPLNSREVILPLWARTFTVEAPAGGTDLRVAVSGSDETPIGANYVDVVAGAGPREFICSVSRGTNLISSFFVASTGASVDYAAEAEAQAR